MVNKTDLQGIRLHSRGKVRDVYDMGDQLLMVSTDRISAFDFVLPTEIPDKGKVLTSLSLFWYGVVRDIVPTHIVTADLARYPEALRPHADLLSGRSMLVHKAEMFPVECVVRAYLAGSGHKEYKETGAVSGHRLPPGLKMADKLPELIFTPATKETSGHDINITYEEMSRLIGDKAAGRLRDLSLAVFRKGSELAERAGILLADTKFEFGVVDGRIVLADEVLTPDSSRFWEASDRKPGESPASFDKQYVRDYLESISWNKKPPVPDLPKDIVEGTRQRYLEIHHRLTGKQLEA
ncbi:MAG: phosphoribosylaminoimidazolesuccinocarboxamide synthase [Candidatus Polarisedimenticolia bacterium]